jgi:small-conductance mechanosensitive channel
MDLTRAFDLLIGKLNDWLAGLITELPNLLVAIVVLSVGLAIARRIRNIVHKSIRRLIPGNPTLVNFAVSAIHIAMAAVVIFTALRLLHLDRAITTALAGAGIVGLGLAFAFQDIAANFMSGIVLTFRRPFNVGDAVRVKDFEGFIRAIELRDTTIQTYQGQIVTMPNKDILQSTLVNFTRLGKRRADVTGCVSKKNDLERVRDVALKALAGVPGTIPGATSFLFDGITENAINFRVQTWIASSERLPWQSFVSDVIIALNEAFKVNQIAVPNDEYTLDLNDHAREALETVLHTRAAPESVL